jgi:ATP-binding cassette, subfamily B, bacterial MsbA
VRGYRELFRFIRPYTGRFTLSLAAGVAGSAMDGLTFVLLIPFLRKLFGTTALLGTIGSEKSGTDRFLGWALGPFLRNATPDHAFVLVVALILISVVLKNAAFYASRLGGMSVQEYVVRDLRIALYSHLQGMRLDYFQRTRGGQLLTRMLADTEQVKPILGDQIGELIRSAATALFYVAILVAISWKLTVLALVLAPFLILALRPLLGRLRGRMRHLLDERGDLTSLMQETVSGVRLVKAYGAEPYELRRFTSAASGYARGVIRWQKLALISQPITESFGAVVTVILLYVGAKMAAGPGAALPPEDFIAFLFVALRMMTPLKFLSNFPATVQTALAAGERVLETMHEPPLEALAEGTGTAPPFTRAVEFRDVAFHYDGGPLVLEGITLAAKKGDIVALVGPSGAGKSTLVDLIPRFYDPSQGVVQIDGRDVRSFTLASLRGQMGIVSQETVLFNDTVKANIAYGALDRYAAPQIEAAAQAANAHEFISRLPSGYDTMLGERGTRLSGGERQRLAIARALLLDPPILILDEATSALDTESERLVQEAIDRLLRGRTVFVIAHRLSTIQHATQILVLEQGHIVERGRHEELLAASGRYRRLYELQFGDEARPAVTA